jgi:hypothetical protein
MRAGDNRRLWEFHALAPRLGLYAGNESVLPVDYEDILPLAARKPLLLGTPKRDRFADHAAVTATLEGLPEHGGNITWQAPNDINRFQSAQHQTFLNWVGGLGN